MDRVLVCAAVNRKRTPYGLQARVTPMRFRDGALITRRRGRLYGLERYYIGDREMLYLLTFVVPRFFHQPFEEKLTTVFHELYHIAPEFNGDIRRLGGRCCVHSRSKKSYDARMLEFARRYLSVQADAGILDFLRWNFDDYQQMHGGARVVIIPRPRLVPIGTRSA